MQKLLKIIKICKLLAKLRLENAAISTPMNLMMNLETVNLSKKR